jgi:hypothetical protein
MKALHAYDECVPTARTTSISLSACPGRLTKVRVSPGDVLRVERGLLWYTIDGRLEDYFVNAGETETIAEKLTLHVTGFGQTDFVLTSSRRQPRFIGRRGVQPYRRQRSAGLLWEGALRRMARHFDSLRSQLGFQNRKPLYPRSLAG